MEIEDRVREDEGGAFRRVLDGAFVQGSLIGDGMNGHCGGRGERGLGLCSVNFRGRQRRSIGLYYTPGERGRNNAYARAKEMACDLLRT